MCCPSNEVVRSFLALGGLQEDKLCVTLQATMTPSNGLSNLLIPYREQPRSTRIMFAYTRPAFPVTKQTKYAPISFSRATSIPRFMMMVETLSCCSWRASQHPAVQSLVLPTKGPETSLFAPCLVFWSRDEGSVFPPRVAPPISRFRSDSGAYSQAPPVLLSSPLKTIWFVDSTGHSTPGLLTVLSLSREAAKAGRKVPA